MIRSFIALPLPDAAAEALAPLQNGLSKARAVPRDNLHLTLVFLGDQPETALRALAAELDTVRAEPIQIKLSGLMLLGGKRPGVIAVGADGGPELARLQARIARRVRDTDIEIERRKFRPHVTIFRIPTRIDPPDARQIQDWIDRNAGFEEIEFSVESFGLYRSILRNNGAMYDTLCDYPLDSARI